jgi:predicted ATPase
MVGRATEWGVLDRLLTAVAGVAAAAALLEGGAGIGKSRLVQGVVDAGPERGVTVLMGPARPFETTRPFGAISEALDLRRGSADPRRAAIARRLAGEAEARTAEPGPDLRYRVVEDIVDLVETLCASAPVLVVLEDLHWADDSTILCFRALLDRLADLPVLLMGTLRPLPRAAGLDAVLDHVAACDQTVMRLGPLSSADVDALVCSEIGVPQRPDLDDLVRRAGGSRSR